MGVFLYLLNQLLLISHYPTQNYLFYDAFHSCSPSYVYSTLFNLLSKTLTPV